MYRILFIVSLFLAAEVSLASSASKFNERFTIQRDEAGKLVAVKLKKVTTSFSIFPFIESLRESLKFDQASLQGLTDSDADALVNELAWEMGEDPYMGLTGQRDEIEALRSSFLASRDADIQDLFIQIDDRKFWLEFEAKINEALLLIDPSVLANPNDSRFFFKKNVAYKVIDWALSQAKKRFSSVPALNLATTIIYRVHEMILEQRTFHHNMLLHYIETTNEKELGLTKSEINRIASSIFEYRTSPINTLEYKKIVNQWESYGMTRFFMDVRLGNAKIESWKHSGIKGFEFDELTKINFAFMKTKSQGKDYIHHLFVTSHQFSKKPALAFDYSKPNKVKINRGLLTLAQVGLGLVTLPNFIKNSAENFIQSCYRDQVRLEGALVGYFESTNDLVMAKKIMSQRANFYIQD